MRDEKAEAVPFDTLACMVLPTEDTAVYEILSCGTVFAVHLMLLRENERQAGALVSVASKFVAQKPTGVALIRQRTYALAKAVNRWLCM